MKSINRTTFLGHVVADPQTHITQTKKTLCRFAIATDNEWKDNKGEKQKSVDFHRVIAWEGLGKLCSEQLRKGTPVYLEGRLTNRSYEGKDGMRHYLTEVVATKIHLLEWQKEKSKIKTKELKTKELATA
jgi:single-strand DNA-binding protein